MIVQLQHSTLSCQYLTPYQPYPVIGIEADDFRLLNNQGHPYLYPAHLFEVVDSHEPTDWVTEFGEDGERYAYSPQLNAPVFLKISLTGMMKL